MTKKSSTTSGGITADRLRSFIERWERLQEEIEGLKADQKEVMGEAKGEGFDTKTIREIIKLRKMSQDERDEREALLDLYKAALGMLNGTPLGDAAIRRLTKPPKSEEPSAPPAPDDGQSDIEDFTEWHTPKSEPAPTAAESPKEPEKTADDAREMGRAAALAGHPVTGNPFPARDPLRSVWDEAWCKATGSDGMDLPAAWRRSSPKKAIKKPDDEKKAA